MLEGRGDNISPIAMSSRSLEPCKYYSVLRPCLRSSFLKAEPEARIQCTQCFEGEVSGDGSKENWQDRGKAKWDVAPAGDQLQPDLLGSSGAWIEAQSYPILRPGSWSSFLHQSITGHRRVGVEEQYGAPSQVIQDLATWVRVIFQIMRQLRVISSHPHTSVCRFIGPVRGSGWDTNSIPYNFQIAFLLLKHTWEVLALLLVILFCSFIDKIATTQGLLSQITSQSFILRSKLT